MKKQLKYTAVEVPQTDTVRVLSRVSLAVCLAIAITSLILVLGPIVSVDIYKGYNSSDNYQKVFDFFVKCNQIVPIVGLSLTAVAIALYIAISVLQMREFEGDDRKSFTKFYIVPVAIGHVIDIVTLVVALVLAKSLADSKAADTEYLKKVMAGVVSIAFFFGTAIVSSQNYRMALKGKIDPSKYEVWTIVALAGISVCFFGTLTDLLLVIFTQGSILYKIALVIGWICALGYPVWMVGIFWYIIYDSSRSLSNGRKVFNVVCFLLIAASVVLNVFAKWKIFYEYSSIKSAFWIPILPMVSYVASLVILVIKLNTEDTTIDYIDRNRTHGYSGY